MQKYRPFTEKILAPNYRLALNWSEGVTFHRVIGVGRTRLTPIVGTNAIGSEIMAEGAAGTPTQRTSFIIKDSSGNYLEDVTSSYKDEIIMQIFYGFAPSWIRIFPSYPADQRDGKILSYAAPTPTSEYGYITGEDSPFEVPTDAAEYWFPYKTRIMFDFANPATDKKAWPAVRAEIVKYRVQHLNPNDKRDAGLIARMARGEAQVYWSTIGPVESPKSFDLRGDWPISPIPLEVAKGVA
jgi:hypothetical protein